MKFTPWFWYLLGAVLILDWKLSFRHLTPKGMKSKKPGEPLGRTIAHNVADLSNPHRPPHLYLPKNLFTQRDFRRRIHISLS